MDADGGNCYPGAATIARDAGFKSADTASRSIHDLVREGWGELHVGAGRVATESGTKYTNVFVPLIPEAAPAREHPQLLDLPPHRSGPPPAREHPNLPIDLPILSDLPNSSPRTGVGGAAPALERGELEEEEEDATPNADEEEALNRAMAEWEERTRRES